MRSLAYELYQQPHNPIKSFDELDILNLRITFDLSEEGVMQALSNKGANISYMTQSFENYGYNLSGSTITRAIFCYREGGNLEEAIDKFFLKLIAIKNLVQSIGSAHSISNQQHILINSSYTTMAMGEKLISAALTKYNKIQTLVKPIEEGGCGLTAHNVSSIVISCGADAEAGVFNNLCKTESINTIRFLVTNYEDGGNKISSKVIKHIDEDYSNELLVDPRVIRQHLLDESRKILEAITKPSSSLHTQEGFTKTIQLNNTEARLRWLFNNPN